MAHRARRILLIICLPLIVLAAIVLTLAMLTLSTSALVPHGGALSSAEIREVEQWIVDNSPSRFESQGVSELSLSDEELNLLSAFALSNVPQLQAVAVDFDIKGDQAEAAASIPRSLGPMTLYLNLRATFAQDQGRARLQELRAGQLPVPKQLIRLAERAAGYRLASSSDASQELMEARRHIAAYNLDNNQLHLRLQWEPEVLSRIRSQAQQILLSDEDRQRIIAYHTLIHDIAAQANEVRRQVSLQMFLPPLFQLAHQRSMQPGADAVAENRTLLQALSFFVNDLSIERVLGSRPGETLPDNPSMIVMLYQRHDLSRHFASAAAIAASAGVGIAEVLSNSKEVHDARYGTGFSFSDMTANVAGAALGELSTKDPAGARQLQQRMMNATAESDYMPEPLTDADGMDEENFVARFGDRTSAAYQQQLKEIEQSVMTLPLYNTAIAEQESSNTL